MKYITVKGLKMAYQEEGEGAPIVLLHGNPTSSYLWRNVVPHLKGLGRCLIPDLIGMGESDPLPESGPNSYRFTEHAGFLEEFLQKLEVHKDAILVGHDWGAMIAWRLAIAHPDRFERFAAVSVGHPATLGAVGKLQMLKSWYIFFFQYRGLGEWMMRGLNWRRLRKLYRSTEDAETAVARLSRPGYLTAGINYYRANMGTFAKRNVPSCKGMPVLGIASDGDPWIPDKALRETKHFVEGFYQFELIEGAGHWIQRDAPDAFNAVLLEFLGKGRPDKI